MRRYAETASRLLEQHFSLPLLEAWVRLATLARNLRLGAAQTGCRSNLSDRALSQAPAEWLLRHFPAFKRKSFGIFLRELDGPFLGGYSTETPYYILALSLLFEEADEGIHYLFRPIDIPKEEISTPREMGRNFWNNRYDFFSYIEHRGIDACTLEFNSYDAPAKIYGVPCLDGLYFETDGLSLLEYFEGESLEKTCARHGASYPKIAQVISAATVSLKRSLRQKKRWRTLKNKNIGY